MNQRDAFIDVIYEAALTDSKIMFLSADFGAPSLDKFKRDLPNQFIHCGISEQNMIDVAVGLSQSGCKTYVFAMAPFFLRCFEQLKLAALMGCPLTVVSVGCGLGYAGSGPTHYATEDLGSYRLLINTEVYTTADVTTAQAVAQRSLDQDKMIVVRLERELGPVLYEKVKLHEGYDFHPGHNELIVTCGFLVNYFKQKGHAICDVWRCKPISPKLVYDLAEYDNVYTFEEQYLPGGFGAAIVEAMSEYGKKTRVFRRGLPERAINENGTRTQLLESFWLA